MLLLVIESLRDVEYSSPLPLPERKDYDGWLAGSLERRKTQPRTPSLISTTEARKVALSYRYTGTSKIHQTSICNPTIQPPSHHTNTQTPYPQPPYPLTLPPHQPPPYLPLPPIQPPQPPRHPPRPHSRDPANKQTNRNPINALSPMHLMLLRALRQLRAFPGLQNAEDQHADEGADELREGREEVEDAEVDAGELAGGGVGACGRGGGGGGVGEVEGWEFDVVVGVEGGGGWEAVVVGCGGAGAEFVDFDAHEGEGGPGGEGPWSVRCAFPSVSGWGFRQGQTGRDVLAEDIHAADSDQGGSEAEGSDKRRERHGAGEDEVREHPRGREVRFQFAERRDERGDAWWGTGREVWFLGVVGRSDEPR